ncbi:MAG: diaminopimelate epimerase [Solirubrobacterales bacterium]
MKFEKWQALGNDYLIIEESNLPWELDEARIQMMCDSHFGVGSDGILLVTPIEDDRYVASLRIFNPDGSEAELSGNGAREAILYLRRHGWTDQDAFSILTKSGPVTPHITSDRTCAVEMGKASTVSEDFPSGGEDGLGSVAADGKQWEFRHISVGNPQCAIEVDASLEGLDLSRIGPEIENSGLFPNRTNVSFFRVSGSRVRARIFERGVGETLSSGTGASGAAVAAFLKGAPSPITVELDGGELQVEISDSLDVTLSGWAEPIMSGELSPEFVRNLGGPGA